MVKDCEKIEINDYLKEFDIRDIIDISTGDSVFNYDEKNEKMF